jgi:hypothetical protein
MRQVIVSLLLTASIACNKPTTETGGPTPPGTTPSGPEDADNDGVNAGDDCDDADPNVFPGATEVCNDVDDDCDGDPDDGLIRDYWADDDGDSYGGGAPTATCAPDAGWVDRGGDCDDGAATVYPEAPELCDSVDNDCDSEVDEDQQLWFVDVDGDGYGIDGTEVLACEAPPGTSPAGGDCDDNNDAVSPGAPELCDDFDVDEDCDGLVDGDDPSTALETLTEVWPDADRDGYGEAGAASSLVCDVEPTQATNADDCDDALGSVNPIAIERCNAVDDDCDGTIDEEPADGTPYYADADADGYGDPDVFVMSCASPVGYVARGDDCDDADPEVTSCGPVDIDRSGSYTGTLYGVLTELSFGVTDTCNVPFNTFTVDEAATPQIRGNATCVVEFTIFGVSFTETKTVLISGSIVADPDIEGSLVVDGISEPYTGSFTGPDTLYAPMTGEFDISGFTVTFDGYYSVSR